MGHTNNKPTSKYSITMFSSTKNFNPECMHNVIFLHNDLIPINGFLLNPTIYNQHYLQKQGPNENEETVQTLCNQSYAQCCILKKTVQRFVCWIRVHHLLGRVQRRWRLCNSLSLWCTPCISLQLHLGMAG